MPLWVAHCPYPLSSVCSLEPQPSTSKCFQHKNHSIWKTGKELRKGVQGLSQCLRVNSKVSSSSVHSEENYVEKGARRFEKRGSYFKRKDEIQREMRSMTEAEGQGRKGISRKSRNRGFFRVFRVEVLLEKDLGKDSFEVSDAVLESTAAALGCLPGILPRSALSVIRKSFDARKNPRFVYTVELDIEECLKQKPSIKSFLSRDPRPGARFGTGLHPVGVSVGANGWRCSNGGEASIKSIGWVGACLLPSTNLPSVRSISVGRSPSSANTPLTTFS